MLSQYTPPFTRGGIGIPRGCTTIDIAGNCVSYSPPTVGCGRGLMARDDGACVPPGPSPNLPSLFRASARALVGRRGGGGGGGCVFPLRRDPSGNCSLFIGDRPGSDDEFQATSGSFGMPAMMPISVQSQRLVCPSGMVLGRDELCYPRAVLRRDSRFRKWKPGARPILTGGERRSIQKAKRSIERARGAISGVGISVTRKK